MLALLVIVDDFLSAIVIFKGTLELVNCRDIGEDVKDIGLVGVLSGCECGGTLPDSP